MKTIRRLRLGLGMVSLLCSALGLAIEAPVRIMPLGDSLTDGNTIPGSPGGYRNRLYALLTDAGYHVDFVGTFADASNPTLPDTDHQGQPGARIDQLHANLPGWLNSVKDPDVVLLLAGTNDFWQNLTLSQIEANFETLLASLATRLPFAKIIVATLPLRTDSASLEAQQAAFNGDIPGIVAAQVALGRQVTYVDLHSAWNNGDLSNDGVHPKSSGYQKMADVWFPGIAAVIAPQGTANPPVIARAAPSADLQHVSVAFSKPIADDSANLANFGVSGGLTLTDAALDSETKRIVTLTTSAQTPGIVYTLSVSGIRDRTPEATPIAPSSMANFSTSAIANGSFENDFAGWTATGNQEIKSDAPYSASNGSKLVAFNTGNSPPNGTLSQTFATTAGQTYKLSFDVGVLGYNTNQQRLRVEILGSSLLVSNTTQLNGLGGGATLWVPKTYSFIANSAATTVTFSDVSLASASSNIDLLLDDVWAGTQNNPTLAVTSTPFAGAGMSLSPAGIGGNGNGVTGLIRAYESGSIVTVTAPASHAGNDFVRWQKNGVDQPGSNLSINVTVDANLTLNAVYTDNVVVLANPDAYSTGEDSQLVEIAPGVLDNDSDSSSQPITAVLVSPTVHGTLSLNADGSFTYVPAPDFHGTDSFTYHASNGVIGSDPAEVTITVEPLEEFHQWSASFGLAVTPTGDSDSDAIHDLLEFVIGGDPANANDVALLPSASIVTADPDGDSMDAPYLRFTYRRAELANADPSTSIVVECGSDLAGPWIESGEIAGAVTLVEDEAGGPGVDLVHVYLPLPENPEGKLFARLKAIYNPP